MVDNVVFDIDAGRLGVQINAVPAVAGARDLVVDDGRVGYVMHQVVQNLVASPASARQAGVIVQRPSVRSGSLDHVPDVVVLADNVHAIGGEAGGRTAQIANGNAGVISVGNVVVKVGNVVPISLRQAFAIREHTRIALNNVVLDRNLLDDISGLVRSQWMVSNMQSAGTNVVKS